MKSVVVQAATVAKAIQTAWLKAGKPEEFFIRVLQEHTSGFLGFGGQKAKIAFFFKNSQKSDSLFPVVLKQKEYANLFSNKSLKTPEKSDVVDHELNKHIPLSSGNNHKKKQSTNQHQADQKNIAKNQHVPKHQEHAADKKNKPVDKVVLHVKHIAVQYKSQPEPQIEKYHQPKPHAKPQAVHAVKVEERVQLSDIKNEPSKVVVQQHKTVVKPEQNLVEKVKAIQPDSFVAQKIDANFTASAKATAVTGIAQSDAWSDANFPASAKAMADANAKEDLVESIAQALKKVQTQKIVANVSRNKPVFNESVDKVAVDKKPKVAQQKFENYADFMDAQADKAAAKTAAIPVLEIEKPVDLSSQNVVKVVDQQVGQLGARPKIVIKRRILNTDNPGVCGITRPSEKKIDDQAVQSAQVESKNE